MMKTEHLLFISLMIPTFLVMAAGAISMADVTLLALIPETPGITAAKAIFPAPVVWDDWLAM